MNRLGPALLLLFAGCVGALSYVAMLGLGLHRHAPAWAISLAATGLVFGPPLVAVALASAERRVVAFGGVLAGWSAFLLLIMPIYFPGERQQAVATGIGLVGLGDDWDSVAQGIAEQLPTEPELSRPEMPEAAVAVAPEALAPLELDNHEIALPFEGQGRRLSVPVAFEHHGKSVEVDMMLDTGATYTTLPTEILDQLGIRPGPGDPVVRLHTANGEREARMVLLDEVWLGDLSIGGIAIAVCEVCGSGPNAGLLGLNVTGGYNLFIDSDRHEVVFSSRSTRDRALDVTNFVDVNASFSRYPGGRVEVVVRFDNRSPRPVDSAVAAIHCGERSWHIDSGQIDPGELTTARRRLPPHTCDVGYTISLDKAFW